MPLVKKYILAAIAALVFFTGWYYWKYPLGAKLQIKNQVFSVDVAVTPRQKERGLSGRISLQNGRGMLFLFDSPGTYNFWMKDMRFPLDFIWISDKTILDLTENVPPPKGNESPVEVSPAYPIDKVLEVNAGTIRRLSIQRGDKVVFLNK